MGPDIILGSYPTSLWKVGGSTQLNALGIPSPLKLEKPLIDVAVGATLIPNEKKICSQLNLILLLLIYPDIKCSSGILYVHHYVRSAFIILNIVYFQPSLIIRIRRTTRLFCLFNISVYRDIKLFTVSLTFYL